MTSSTCNGVCPPLVLQHSSKQPFFDNHVLLLALRFCSTHLLQIMAKPGDGNPKKKADRVPMLCASALAFLACMQATRLLKVYLVIFDGTRTSVYRT